MDTDHIHIRVVLRDPSVATAALDQRISFLKSKNLTQEEIDVSLARAGDNPSTANNTSQNPSNLYSPPSHRLHQAPRYPQGYGSGYGPYQSGPWDQAPFEPPRRDWRDWFIMATVTTSASYGLYTLAKVRYRLSKLYVLSNDKAPQRYVLPLISPPTPPQLEADKAAIDASFSRAFALIDQLTSDTAEIKASEVQRTEKLDNTIKDVDTVIEELKEQNKQQEMESRIIADQVRGLKDLIPKALEGWKAKGDAKLEDINQEMQSLKRLLENRVGRSGTGGGSNAATGNRGSTPARKDGNEKYGEKQSSDSKDSNLNLNLESTASTSSSTSAPAPGITTPRSQDSAMPSSPGSRIFERSDRRAAIPAWQMAASGKGSNSESSSKVEAAA